MPFGRIVSLLSCHAPRLDPHANTHAHCNAHHCVRIGKCHQGGSGRREHLDFTDAANERWVESKLLLHSKAIDVITKREGRPQLTTSPCNTYARKSCKFLPVPHVDKSNGYCIAYLLTTGKACWAFRGSGMTFATFEEKSIRYVATTAHLKVVKIDRVAGFFDLLHRAAFPGLDYIADNLATMHRSHAAHASGCRSCIVTSGPGANHANLTSMHTL